MNQPLILHTINSLGLGGAEVLLRDTIAGLTSYDHVVCYLNSPDTLADSFDERVTVYRLEHQSWSDSFQTIKSLRRIIRKHQPHLVHAHLLQATLLTRLAISSRQKFFFTIHNVLSKDAFEINKISLHAEKLSYRPSHHLISVSKQALADYDQWVGIKGRSSVLYNYVHHKYFELDLDPVASVEQKFKLVAVGNLRRQKNYSLLLQSFRYLKDLPVSLDIFGGGDLEEELQELISREQLPVRLMGRAEDISKVLPDYNAYIMASLFEGFGIAPMEAMAAGLPVLLSDLPVFRELAEEIPCYFDPNNPCAIAEAIRFAWQNWSEMKERAKSGKVLVCNKASQEVYFKKLIEIYTSN